jgi:Flp pilus assembly pilin Flp
MVPAEGSSFLRALWNDETAPTAAEYAIMLAGIAVAIFATVATFGEAVNGLFANVVAKWPP